VVITVAGLPDHPTSWSVQQYYDWASSNALHDIAGLIREHKFAGDIIADASLEVCSVRFT
jgi:hypothetical protein